MLLEAIRRLALQGTELARAYVGTLRLKLLKIGAVILRNTRRIRFPLSGPPSPHYSVEPAKLQKNGPCDLVHATLRLTWKRLLLDILG